MSILSSSFFRFKYKDEYEKFKFVINGIGLTISVINILANSRYVFRANLGTSRCAKCKACLHCDLGKCP